MLNILNNLTGVDIDTVGRYARICQQRPNTGTSTSVLVLRYPGSDSCLSDKTTHPLRELKKLLDAGIARMIPLQINADSLTF